MIVDAHAHLGHDFTFDEEFTEAELLASQRDNGIDVTFVQPGTAHDLRTAQAQHDAIADLARRHPGRFHGIANPSPYLPEEEYTREVRRCVRDLGFRGVKLRSADLSEEELSWVLGRTAAVVFGLTWEEAR